MKALFRSGAKAQRGPGGEMGVNGHPFGCLPGKTGLFRIFRIFDYFVYTSSHDAV